MWRQAFSHQHQEHVAGDGTNIIAVQRGERMLAPRADLVLEAGDRMIFIAAESELARMQAPLEPW